MWLRKFLNLSFILLSFLSKEKIIFKLNQTPMDKLKFICSLLIILSLLLTSLYYLNFNQNNSSYIIKLSKKKEKMSPILVWNNCSWVDKRGIGYPDFPVDYPDIKCPYECTFTNDRKFEANASTTIFLLHTFCPINEYPKNRRQDQNYMMYTAESPIQTIFKYYDRKFLTNTFFNSSATYRPDSSVYMPYDALTKITPNTPKEYIWDQKEVLARVKNKKKLAYIAVTHCNAESGRDLLTRKIKELVKIDAVGHCFGGETPRENHGSELESHFFYLAFENNMCLNYVTEKFWSALRALTVPVVLSRDVFKGMDVPSNSFIAVDDFKSVNELVDYLKVLRNDTEKYLKYFEWTKTYTKRKFGLDYSPICKICEYATKQFEEKTKNIIDLNIFWNEKECNNKFSVKKFLGI
ncbi:hypothetical protein ACQ4LE_000047 [Meloidogyne hapla]